MNSSSYIVLEGVDGSGKSSLTAALLKALPNTIPLREPGSSSYGEGLRNLLLGCSISDTARLLGMFSARAETLKTAEALLAEGKTVISDRGALSSYVYQCGDWVNEKIFHDLCTALVPSNIIYVVLDIDYDTYKARRPVADDQLEADVCGTRLSFNNLRERYKTIGHRYKAIIVDARCSEAELLDTVLYKLRERFDVK